MSTSPYPNDIILFKYGGNAMKDPGLSKQVLKAFRKLHSQGKKIVIVHGGGPFIRQALECAGIRSVFEDGHRVTPPEAYEHVEMALKGKVNSRLVRTLNAMGAKAVGLTGQDGGMIRAVRRPHYRTVAGKTEAVDLGRVGDVQATDPALLHLLLDKGYLPVISCLAADEAGAGLNINADMVAGHIAGALQVAQYVVLTDVDGLFRDRNDPDSLIPEMRSSDIETLEKQGVIAGGMIPKLRSCAIALQKGAQKVRIINGTRPELLEHIDSDRTFGTVIKS